MEITLDVLKKIIFSDFDVKKMDVFFDEKKIFILMEGGILDNRVLKDIEIIFFNFEKVELKLFDNENQKWVNLTKISLDKLKDICEFLYDNNNIILRGFGENTGKWIEYKIYNPEIKSKLIE